MQRQVPRSASRETRSFVTGKGQLWSGIRPASRRRRRSSGSLGISAAPCWQADDKASRLGIHLDAATMHATDLTDDGKAKSGAAGSRIFALLKRCLVKRSAGLTSPLTFFTVIALVLTFSWSRRVCVSRCLSFPKPDRDAIPTAALESVQGSDPQVDPNIAKQ